MKHFINTLEIYVDDITVKMITIIFSKFLFSFFSIIYTDEILYTKYEHEMLTIIFSLKKKMHWTFS